MPNDGQNQPVLPAPNTTDKGDNQITLELYRFFNEAAKLTVFAIFILYSIGFIVWHSYLATYGISSIEFLQTEYLSAAFCYLFLAISFSIPPALLFERLIMRLGKRENPESEKVSFLIFFWYLLCTRLIRLFFLDPNPSKIPEKYFNWGCAVIALYFITMLTCAKKWGSTKIYNKIWNVDFVSIFLMGYVTLFLFLNHEVSKVFLFSTLSLYLVMIFFAGKDIRRVWKNADLLLKILILGFVSLILISNVELFGNLQFGDIPKEVGGGKPETAFLKLSQQSEHLSSFLDIPDSDRSTNNVLGPIKIILRSDKEIIFLNDDEFSKAEFVTNEITNVKTNLQVTILTNWNSGKVENLVKSFRTNLVVTVTTNITKNVPDIIAKQVRADLVDGIIFAN